MNHVCLVSEQPMPNFLPVMDERLKPQHVTLAVSSRMRRQAEWLKNEMRKQKVEILDDICLGDSVSELSTLQNIFLDWGAQNPEILNESILNVTGGTKLMAIAAQEFFRSCARPVFYVDVRNDKVMWIGADTSPMELTHQPNLTQFLGVHGLIRKGGAFSCHFRQWQGVVEAILDNVNALALNMGFLTSFATRVKGGGFAKADFDGIVHSPLLWQILNDAHVIVSTRKHYRLANSDAERFCNGLWLEDLLYFILVKLNVCRKCALINAKIENERGIGNEFDSLVLHGNSCSAIECKAGASAASSADGVIYKLAQVSKQMGLRCRGILIAAHMLSPENRDRATTYGVTVIDWLPDLLSQLKVVLGI